MSRIVGVLVAMSLVVVACGGEETVRANGVERVPDAVGIVTDATLERITLDGDRTYEIDDEVESFKTRSHQLTPLLSWEGKYVHLGLDGDDRVRWIAGIGAVIAEPEPRVIYSGVVAKRDAGQAFFEDGTVLTVREGVKVPEPGTEIVCEIDPGPDVVTRVT